MTKTPELRILSWDIEASNLSADFGIILCVGAKLIGKPRTQVLDILDYMGKDRDIIKAEGRLLKAITPILQDCDVWLTHFGPRFDLPFVNSRLLYHHLPPINPSQPHIDTWRTARNRLKLHSNRLNSIQTFLGLPTEKNAIKPEQWLRALSGHRPSMNYIVEHCRLDVECLEEAYMRLRPLIINHPNVNLVREMGGCPRCGSRRLQKRGTQIAASRSYVRYQCQDCGGWTKANKSDGRTGLTAL